MSRPNALQGKIQREICELSDAISRVVESFKEVKNPLMESQEKVPQATSQLDKISEQTEAAAHQMLDRVEKITQREEDIIAGLGQIREFAEGGDLDRLKSTLKEMDEKANTNLNDAYMIMDALQFQDITTQQMNHAAALLEEIETKLKSITSALNGNPVNDEQEEPTEEAPAAKTRVYDPHAEFVDKQTEQNEIDSLFAKAQKQ